MIKKATVISQRPSAAKKGLYLTVLDDGGGELRAYSSRKLNQGDEIVVSVQQGMNRDPLSVHILNKKQTENWLKQQEPEVSVPVKDTPEVSFDAIQQLIYDALTDFVDGWEDISTNTFCGWLIDKSTKKADIAKFIHAEARELNYITEGGQKPVIYVEGKEYPRIEVTISVITNDEYDPRVNITLYEIN